MAIVTRETVKELLGIDDDEKDGRIDALIPLVEEHYREIRNAPFETDDEGDTIYPRGSALTAAMMVGYQLQRVERSLAMSSESLGDYSYTLADGGDDEYPAQVIGSIRRYVGAK